MPSTDPADRRMFTAEESRHKTKVREIAAHIETYAGYLVRAVERGESGDDLAQTLEADVAELRRRIAVLGALDNVRFLVADDSREALGESED